MWSWIWTGGGALGQQPWVMWGFGYLLMFTCSLFLFGLKPKCVMPISWWTVVWPVWLYNLVGLTEICRQFIRSSPRCIVTWCPGNKPRSVFQRCWILCCRQYGHVPEHHDLLSTSTGCYCIFFHHRHLQHHRLYWSLWATGKAQSPTQSWQSSFCVIWAGAVFPG